jgi:ribosomal protein L3
MANVYICKICKEEKDESSFYIRKESGKPRSECKVCWCNKTSKWQDDNKDKVKGYVRKSCKKAYDANPEKYREKTKIARQNNQELYKIRAKNYYVKKQSNITDDEREKRRLNSLNWAQKNRDKAQESQRKHRNLYPERHAARQNKRRAIKVNATPLWLTDIHLMQIQWYYAAAKMMTKTTKIPHEVDHIHPLKGKGFNGLHVPWNLQILKASDNRKKSNNFKEF